MPRGQDDLTRQRRLNDGCCPTHGISLVQIGVEFENKKAVGDIVCCPRGDCLFKRVVKPGTKLWDALRDAELRMFNA